MSGGGYGAGERWIKYLIAVGLVVGGGKTNMDDILALTPKGLHALERTLVDGLTVSLF